MPRKLTAQDKLALALTSAGSMRELARRVGVTHQKVGRWLREGEAGGSPIPTDFFVQLAIDQAFIEHREATQRQARRDRTAYVPEAPVMMVRKPLSTGAKGDRVVVDNTQFIKPDIRAAVFQRAVDVQKFYAGSVRSVVTLRTYFRGRAASELARGRRAGITEGRLARAMMDSWIKREATQHGRQIDPERPFPLYTRAEGLSLGAGTTLGVQGIEKQLRQKHEPATGAPGTVAADQFLFQLTPEGFVPHEKAPPVKRSGQRRLKRRR